MTNSNQNDNQAEIMDDSFSFFAEELIKSIFDYQLGRTFNNKENHFQILANSDEHKVPNPLVQNIIEILKKEILSDNKQKGIQIISCETRTQIKISVKLEGNEINYNLDGEQKVDVGIFIEYKFNKNDNEINKIMIPFEVKTGEKGLNKAKIKECIESPKINTSKNGNYLKGNMLGFLSRTKIDKKSTDLKTNEQIPLTKTFGLIMRQKIYEYLHQEPNDSEPLVKRNNGNENENNRYESFRKNHKFFGLEALFKNFANEYFLNEYPEAVLYQTLENMLNNGQITINPDELIKSKDRKIKEAFNKFVHQFLNTIETDFYKAWIATEIKSESKKSPTTKKKT